MIRFGLGLLTGLLCAAVTYAVGHSPEWTTSVGTVGALLVWAGPAAVDYVADVLDDL